MRTLRECEDPGEVEPLVALFTDQAKLENLASKTPSRGREGARQFWQHYLADFQRVRSTFTHVVEAPDRSSWSGTRKVLTRMVLPFDTAASASWSWTGKRCDAFGRTMTRRHSLPTPPVEASPCLTGPAGGAGHVPDR